MGKMKDKAIQEQNSQKAEYIIVGSDNFWYASGLTSLKEAKEVIKNIKKNIQSYADPETGERQTEVPETFYIYQGRVVDTFYN